MDGVRQRSCATGAYDLTDEPTRCRVDGERMDALASGAAATSDRVETDLTNNLSDLCASKKNRHVVNHDVKVCVLTFPTRESRMRLRNSLVQRSSGGLFGNVTCSGSGATGEEEASGQGGWQPAPGSPRKQGDEEVGQSTWTTDFESWSETCTALSSGTRRSRWQQQLCRPTTVTGRTNPPRARRTRTEA